MRYFSIFSLAKNEKCGPKMTRMRAEIHVNIFLSVTFAANFGEFW